MVNRKRYLVCYDICEPGRLKRVYKYLSGFKVGGQKSFFECWLTATELCCIRDNLRNMIDINEDRLHIFLLDPRMSPGCYGIATTSRPGKPFMVV